MSEYDFICDIHCLHKQETALSPCRGTCRMCKKKESTWVFKSGPYFQPFRVFVFDTGIVY